MGDETFPRVAAIIARYLDVAVETITIEAKLEELGMDSLGAYELVFEIEEEFKILVPNERAAEFSTVRAICEGIESLQGSAPAS